MDTRPAAPSAPRRPPLDPRWATAFLPQLIAGTVAALATAGLAADAATPLESAMIVWLCFLAGAALLNREPQWARLLPLMGVVARLAAPAAALAAIVALRVFVGLPDLAAAELAAVGVIGGATRLVAGRVARGLTRARRRIAVVGSARSAESLARELRLNQAVGAVAVGRITWPEDDSAGTGEVPCLGGLDDLGALVAEHDIDLLLMTGEVPRLAVFEEIAHSCLHLPVRLSELSAFYEESFGHVPVAEINASWFQHIMHPRYRREQPRGQRVLDVLIAGLVGLALLPLIGLLALLIRRDGGPAFFRQQRVGESGRPFTMIKLRTMRTDADNAWAGARDPRVTPLGSILRKTHLDELPQLLNVLRGEMSIIGPRPEQPAFVEELERVVPFYQRRHLVKPGVTGWAQVRCGYAGSDVGSAWKVCHDLYYLKHRSFWFNVIILGETLRTLVADPQYAAEPSAVEFILAPTQSKLDRSPVSSLAG